MAWLVKARNGLKIRRLSVLGGSTPSPGTNRNHGIFCNYSSHRSALASIRGLDLGVVPFARIHFESAPGFLRHDRDRTVVSVAIKVGGPVGNQIAAADHLLKLGETSIQVTGGSGEERNCSGQPGQHL